MQSKIILCTCTHPYQDKKYGKGKRVHNPCGKGMSQSYRCTVCKKENDK